MFAHIVTLRIFMSYFYADSKQTTKGARANLVYWGIQCATLGAGLHANKKDLYRARVELRGCCKELRGHEAVMEAVQLPARASCVFPCPVPEAKPPLRPALRWLGRIIVSNGLGALAVLSLMTVSLYGAQGAGGSGPIA